MNGQSKRGNVKMLYLDGFEDEKRSHEPKIYVAFRG